MGSILDLRRLPRSCDQRRASNSLAKRGSEDIHEWIWCVRNFTAFVRQSVPQSAILSLWFYFGSTLHSNNDPRHDMGCALSPGGARSRIRGGGDTCRCRPSRLDDWLSAARFHF